MNSDHTWRPGPPPLDRPGRYDTLGILGSRYLVEVLEDGRVIDDDAAEEITASEMRSIAAHFLIPDPPSEQTNAALLCNNAKAQFDEIRRLRTENARLLAQIPPSTTDVVQGPAIIGHVILSGDKHTNYPGRINQARGDADGD